MIILNYILGAGLAISMFYAATRKPDGVWLMILFVLFLFVVVITIRVLPMMMT